MSDLHDNIHDLLYVRGNAFVPEGRVSSTARRGDKWFKLAKPGDFLNLRVTEGEQFGAAILIEKELVTFRDVLENADHNHTAFNPRYDLLGGMRVPSNVALRAELQSAYGPIALAEPFTILHILRLNGCSGLSENPLNKVYDAIESEILYQDAKYGGEDDHHVPSWILFMQDYLNKAAHEATRDDEDEALHIIRKVTAMGVRCLDAHGAPMREGFTSFREAGKPVSFEGMKSAVA